MEIKGIRTLVLGLVVLALLLVVAAPAALASGDVQLVAGDKLTPEGLTAIAGVVLSLVLAYVPGLSDRYNALPGKYKAPLMGVLLFAVAVGVFVAGCGSVVDVGVTCDRPGVWSLVGMLVTALMSNQGTYLLAVEPFKAKPPETLTTTA